MNRMKKDKSNGHGWLFWGEMVLYGAAILCLIFAVYLQLQVQQNNHSIPAEQRYQEYQGPEKESQRGAALYIRAVL